MHQNRLIHEQSPYLLQHAHNPVDWWPWGEAAFEEARRRDVPIFLSVGYSTCHWCHVMERESFEDARVAEVLNRDFVPVKVDREERPDVDRVYMLFVQATTGGGGWPMSVWLTPDLKPFYGGTYFPPQPHYGRPAFIQVLDQIAAAWRERRDKLVASANGVLADLTNYATRTSKTDVDVDDAAARCFASLQRSYDGVYGGFGAAPKFPRPVALNFLFRYHASTGNEEARDMALATLRAMADGGMHDQIGGGFHRYSVDERWFVPHFEKMLYDQAQLATSYLEALQITGDAQYANVARAIFDYVLRDMRDEGGGFYSAEDADSAVDANEPTRKSEGAFYLWSHDELIALLGERRAERFVRIYGCRENGNVDNDPHGEFVERNILYRASDEDDAELAECRAILFKARGQRPRPHLDDKVLTAWNAMFIAALARGARILEERWPDDAQRYGEAATIAWRFVMRELYDPRTRTLYRRWRKGTRAIEAFAEDYAALIDAHVELYESFHEPVYLELASALAEAMLERFEDRDNGGLFSASAAADLVLRLKDDYDGAEPAANSMAAYALARLAAYTGADAPRQACERTVRAFSTALARDSQTLPQMLCAALHERAPHTQIVIAGAGHEAMLRVVRRRFLPFAAVHVDPRLAPLDEMRPVDGRATAFVCENFACQLPVTTLEGLERALSGRR